MISPLLILFLALARAALVEGNHSTCSWRIDGEPDKMGYKHLCTAPIRGGDVYKCSEDAVPIAFVDRQVADWGKLKDKVLELCESRAHHQSRANRSRRS